MKEYLNERIKLLSNEYSELLTEIGNKTNLSDVENNTKLWEKVADRKARIEELKEILKFHNENNYTNL